MHCSSRGLIREALVISISSDEKLVSHDTGHVPSDKRIDPVLSRYHHIPKRVSVPGERRQHPSGSPGDHVSNPGPIGTIVDVVMTGDDQANACFQEEPMEPVSLFLGPVQSVVPHDGKERFVEEDELVLKRLLPLRGVAMHLLLLS